MINGYLLFITVFLLLFWLPSAQALPCVEYRDYLPIHLLAPQPLPQHHVLITIFFSEASPAYQRLSPALEQWSAHLPNTVKLVFIPVCFNKAWYLYARTDYALWSLQKNSLVKQPLSMAISRQFPTLKNMNEMLNFLNRFGIDRQQFLQAYYADIITTEVTQAQQLAHDLIVDQVPTIVVDNRYKVDQSLAGASNKRLLQIVNALIAKQIERRHIR